MQTSATSGLVPMEERPEHRMAAHIREAAEATGVPFDFLLAQANQESRLNPDATSRRSSAMGLFQFTAGTWLEMVKKHGADHGLDAYADVIEMGKDGRWTVQDKALKKEILDLRRDPKMSALMAGEYAKDNEKVLEAKLGRQASAHDLYLAHFLGAGGALKVLKERTQADGGDHQPELNEAAKANPEVFNDPVSGEARSLATIYSTVERRFKRAMADAARMVEQMRPKVDLAALRPQGRPAPQVEAPVMADAGAGADPAKGSVLALSMADIPASISEFPARLPPREASGDTATDAFPVAIVGKGLGQTSYPVSLPPPLSGAHADAGTLRNLMKLTEEKG